MQRIHLYLKVVIEVDNDDKPDRLGTEVCRQIKRVYGVQRAEVQNMQSEIVKDVGL